MVVYPAEVGKPSGKFHGIHYFLHRVFVAFFGYHRTFREFLGCYFLYALQQPAVVVAHEHCLVAYVVQQRCAAVAVAAAAVDYRNGIDILHRELCLHIEGAYAFYLVAEVIHAIRKLKGKGIHIEYRTAHGKLPRLIHIVHLYKAKLPEPLRHLGEVAFGVLGQCHRRGFYVLAALHFLGKCLGIGHHAVQLAVGVPAIEHLGAKYLLRRIYLPVFYVALIPRGEH